MEKIQKEIIDILINEFQVSETINIDSPLSEYGIDSLKTVELVLIIEKKYGFEFESENLSYATLRNVKSISNYIDLRLGDTNDK